MTSSAKAMRTLRELAGARKELCDAEEEETSWARATETCTPSRTEEATDKETVTAQGVVVREMQEAAAQRRQLKDGMWIITRYKDHKAACYVERMWVMWQPQVSHHGCTERHHTSKNTWR